MSPQTHARVDEKHFEIVGPTFSKTVGEFAEEVDCSQSPYVSAGFSRPVRFDGIAAILVS